MSTTVTELKISRGYIKTTVTSEASIIDDVIRSFLTDKDLNRVIGLDTESGSFTNSAGFIHIRTAILELCNGKQCLIVQLWRLDYIPSSLLNFLRLPYFAFVGIGIKESVHNLHKEYRIGCKNLVELGPLAGNVWNPRYNNPSGIEVERKMINSLEGPISAVFDDWGANILNKEQIECATINTYLFQGMGKSLFSPCRFGFEL